ncbi:MAG: hypothetical protein GWP10_01105 [Nitrospiraceae bacterium]|nr:hypothetical protein [Nitrospiraceae bacterium]
MTIIKPDSLLTLPGAKAEVLMNKLTLAEQASVVLMTPWERRQEIILLSKNARALVQGLPVEELFWTIKAIGPRDAVHILSLTVAEQLQFIFDLDWWHKAELRPEKIAAWILLLFEAGEDTVASWLQWLMTKDETLLPAILGPFIQVYKRPDDMDIQEVKDKFPPFTLEDVYFLSFKKQALQPILSRFIKKIPEVSPGLYRDILETMLMEDRSENLEMAFRWRRSRIEDYGIPDYYDALDIYAPLEENQIRRVKAIPYDNGNLDTLLPAFVPSLYLGDYPVLRAAVEGLLGTKAIERIIHEWVGAANKLLMADEVDLDDPEALRRCLFRVSALLNLGLEITTRTENRPPEKLLGSSVVEDIIRLANAMTTRLAAKAHDLTDSGQIPNDLAHLPDSWVDVLKGLLRKRPMLWDSTTSSYHTFSNMSELSMMEKVVSHIGEWAHIMSYILSPCDHWVQEIPWNTTNFGHPNEVIWPQLLLTALAQEILTGDLRLYPVPEGKLSLLRKMWSLDRPSFTGEEGALPPETIKLCTKAMQPINDQVGLTDTGLNKIVREALMPLYREWKDLPKDAEIDGRFISALVVEL